MLVFWAALLGGFLLLRSTKVGARKAPAAGAPEIEASWGRPDDQNIGEGVEDIPDLSDVSEDDYESFEAAGTQGAPEAPDPKSLVIEYNPFREGQKRQPSPYTVRDAPRTNGSLDDLQDEEIDAELMGDDEEDQFADEEEDEDGGE